MNPTLKLHLIETFGLAEDASDEDAQKLASAKLLSKDLSVEKYTELLAAREADKTSAQEKLAELLEQNSKATATAVVEGLTPVLTELGKALQGRSTPPEETNSKESDEPEPPEAPEDYKKQLSEMEQRLIAKFSKEHGERALGGDGAALMKMAAEDPGDDPVVLRVKNAAERFRDVKTAATYSKRNVYQAGQPIVHNGREVNVPTDRSKAMTAAWFKFDAIPESLTDHDKDICAWAIHHEKFYADELSTEPRRLNENERKHMLHLLQNAHMKALIDDSSSGGQFAVPEFFDTEVIILPVLSNENAAQYVDVMEVPRGSAAQGFQMGNLSFSAANTEGSAVGLFTTTSFLANHDTTFFRAAGFIEVGRNWLLDAVPGMADQIRAEYSRQHNVWLDEQIMAGDGTTEPQGVKVANGTTDITPTNPTTGSIVINDILNLLFGVSKAFREAFGQAANREKGFYAFNDQTYKRIRSIVTGVTGDTRYIFGEDVEGYRLFGHPVVIEENGLDPNDGLFCQGMGYKLYRRQGLRFFRESAGDTLTRNHTVLIGADMRYGGQLKRGGYAAVVDAFPTS